MDFKTIKEIEALFKCVSSNIYYIYMCKKIKYFGIWAFVKTLNLAGIWVKIVVYWFYYLTYFYHLKGNFVFCIFLRESVENW